MLTVYNCLVTEHDLRLVVLAAIVCALASFTAISLLHHVRRSDGKSRQVWLVVAAVSSGFGIWATHFIGMLAFSPHLPSGYDVTLTALSLLVAILVTGVGVSVALISTLSPATWLGGAIVGAGISFMHYVGMAAFQVPGWISWDPALVAVSIASGVVLAALSMFVGLRGGGALAKGGGALLLTLAICSMHFTAMGAVTITPDPSIGISDTALPTRWLAVGVALASLGILFLSFSGLVLDIRERRRAGMEAERMRSLADAAIEGLIVCDGSTIVSVNSSFETLSGAAASAVIGTSLRTYFPDEAVCERLLRVSQAPVETEMLRGGGGAVPVELIVRQANYAGKLHNVVAVRDLQARKKAEARIQFLAHHDPLTGLPNRASFDRRLELETERHRKEQKQFAVLFLDLDRFKDVNDLYGHAAGDQLLQKAAERLSAILTDGQVLARLGGDEFALIAPEIAHPSQVGHLAEAMLDAMRGSEGDGPFALVSVSIGIAIFPGDATSPAVLLSNADAALYRAKSEGRGTYRFFEASMGEAVRERRMLEHDLRCAVANGEMSIVYQPQTEILTGDVTGFEALVRWHHAKRGEVQPSMFIPVAEESGAILKIGEWVLWTACLEAAQWVRPLKIAVNVSAVQLNNAGFVETVEAILVGTGLYPRRLEIEITETALIRDPARALKTLTQLKELGVCIAMDDFGTGYSSLSNLRCFPFDRIKIDRSFIRSIDVNEQAATIVKAVLGLGRGLGLPVVAEGVETLEELEFLNAQGCLEAQGYLFGRPAPIDRFQQHVQPAEIPGLAVLSA